MAAAHDTDRALRILDALEAAHPDARIYLDYESPLQLLVATMLAAQCTDARVNEVTPRLFARYATASALAEADTAELEELIRPTGFFRQKARSVQACCRALVEEHGGGVPDDMDADAQAEEPAAAEVAEPVAADDVARQDGDQEDDDSGLNAPIPSFGFEFSLDGADEATDDLDASRKEG